MSKKHVEEYYDQICQDYHDMIEALHDLEEEAMQGLISPQRVEETKEVIKPLKDNYMRISYIMYLLNKPSKFELFLNKIGIKTKSKLYSQRVDDTATLEAVRKEDKECIDKLK